MGESPEECGVREVLEELGLKVEVRPPLDAWAYEPLPERRVLVLAYGCSVGEVGRMAYGDERTALGSFGAVRARGGMARKDRPGSDGA